MNPIVLMALGVAAWCGNGWLALAMVIVGLFGLLVSR